MPKFRVTEWTTQEVMVQWVIVAPNKQVALAYVEDYGETKRANDMYLLDRVDENTDIIEVYQEVEEMGG